jgi:hypothetical protein
VDAPPGPAAQSSDGLALTAPDGTTPTGTGAGATAATPGASSLVGTNGQAVVGSGGVGGQPAASTAPLGAGRGLPANAPVRVGVLYVKDASAGAAALGVNGLTTGDTEAQAKAVISWINDHGAAAGHKMVPFFAGIDFEEANENPQHAEEAACAQLTQDDHVQFVVSYVALYPAAMACFAKGGASVIDDQSLLADWMQQKYADVFAAPGDFAPGRMLRELVDALWRTGWLTKASKVGTYGYDNPDSRRLVDENLTQALAVHGLTITKKEFITDDASGFAQSGNVSLQFSSAGVDRVIPVLASPLFLMQAASSQHYYPKYAMYSSFGPGALIETAAPKDQLAGSRGIGWSPYLDIGSGTHPGPVNANEVLCFDIYKKNGQASTSPTTKGFQLNLCSALLYLKFAADRVGSVPADLLGQARPLVGASFAPPDTFRSDMRHHPDGAGGYRDLAYEQKCGCYQYVSPVRTTTG